jgi:nucleoside diphosphate-linked moiety X motif protein 19
MTTVDSTTANGADNPIREAASLIVAAKNPRARAKSAKFNPREYSIDLNDARPNDDVQTDYHLLMTKRSGKSSYLASAYVFPGGHVDVADFNGSSWTALFDAAGLKSQLQRLTRLNAHLPRPRILASPLMLQRTPVDNALPAEIAFRINAIRETFEETGVLIAVGSPYLQDYIFEYGKRRLFALFV